VLLVEQFGAILGCECVVGGFVLGVCERYVVVGGFVLGLCERYVVVGGFVLGVCER
jgi:hypothetical protein